jgi:cystathionine beta-lyase/cystathionine gamma-synthase
MGTAPYVEEVRQKMIVWGQAADPFACWLLERGLKTLELRVHRQNENAMRLAQWCSERPEFARVHYPGLPSHPDHDLASEMMDGFGGMMAVELAGGGDAAHRFVSRLEVVTHAASLGGVDTLVSEPRYTSHVHMTPEERAAIGIPDGFVRVSVGIESAEDLIADFAQALD